MTECVFTLDYEIYGNGKGSLRELVLEPTERLAELFREFHAPFVVFAEAVEFPKIEEARSDPDAGCVRVQLRELQSAGHEIGLHLHPWWANAQHENGEWRLDWSERNICTLPPERVEAIVFNAICYLREAMHNPLFTPVSFRSGLWAMQPSAAIADSLQRHGVRVDSSVFHGGRIRELGLDYRRAPSNECSWRFSTNVTTPHPSGALLEIPIHTEMVPFWRMLGRKRLSLQNKARSSGQGTPLPRRLGDFLRYRYPRKLDFCRMTFEELRDAIDRVLNGGLTRDESNIVVAIGHSKDFADGDAVRRFLEYLQRREVSVTTFTRLSCVESMITA